MVSSAPAVEVANLYKVFGKQPQLALQLLEQGKTPREIFELTGMTVALNDVSFRVTAGEIFVLMGLSGCGKSTLLRTLNRLIEPTRGTVHVAGREVTALSERELIALRREKLGMVFQSFALLPRQRVWENAAFALEIAGVGRDERRERALQVLARVGLEHHADSYPAQLSGGMQQRVGLARALCGQAPILLMDEAFSALDPLIRTEMQDELLSLARSSELTIVFVSHDLDEAIRIGQRIAIMQAGRIVQLGSAHEILSQPKNDFVRSFFQSVDPARIERLTANATASAVEGA
jgi:glycine betaine/proline transport system ATP-binding protein